MRVCFRVSDVACIQVPHTTFLMNVRISLRMLLKNIYSTNLFWEWLNHNVSRIWNTDAHRGTTTTTTSSITPSTSSVVTHRQQNNKSNSPNVSAAERHVGNLFKEAKTNIVGENETKRKMTKNNRWVKTLIGQEIGKWNNQVAEL